MRIQFSAGLVAAIPFAATLACLGVAGAQSGSGAEGSQGAEMAVPEAKPEAPSGSGAASPFSPSAGNVAAKPENPALAVDTAAGQAAEQRPSASTAKAAPQVDEQKAAAEQPAAADKEKAHNAWLAKQNRESEKLRKEALSALCTDRAKDIPGATTTQITRSEGGGNTACTQPAKSQG